MVVVPCAVMTFLVVVLIIMYASVPTSETVMPHNYIKTKRISANHSLHNDLLQFPSIVHHTWKTGSAPPAETVRWRDGCKRLNPDFQFKMYDDDDLYKFTEKHYPEYFPLFKALSGVCKCK